MDIYLILTANPHIRKILGCGDSWDAAQELAIAYNASIPLDSPLIAEVNNCPVIKLNTIIGTLTKDV